MTRIVVTHTPRMVGLALSWCRAREVLDPAGFRLGLLVGAAMGDPERDWFRECFPLASTRHGLVLNLQFLCLDVGLFVPLERRRPVTIARRPPRPALVLSPACFCSDPNCAHLH